MSPDLEEEIEAINAIYGSQTVTIGSNGPVKSTQADSAQVLVRAPTSLAVIRLTFEKDYPQRPPSVDGIETAGSETIRGHGQEIINVAKDALQRLFVAGEVCLFELISAIEEHDTGLVEHQATGEDSGPAPIDPSPKLQGTENGVKSKYSVINNLPWVESVVLEEKKSVFVARSIVVTSPDDANEFIDRLRTEDRKVAKATHNITAYRVKNESGLIYQDSDDDGEDAAGGRLLHLMQLLDVWNVLIVVSRWYGGTKLGPDRFKLINNCARDALARGGFLVERDKQTRKHR